MMDTQDNAAGPSSPRVPSSVPVEEEMSDEEGGFGLSDLIPEPESPLRAPYSFATYDVPDDLQLPIAEGRNLVVVRLVSTHPLWAHHLWNTSRVMSSFLLRNPSIVKSKRILELGAGAGLPSIVSALSGAERVIVTDYPEEESVRNMAYNLDINLEGKERECAEAAGHVWGADVKPLRQLLNSGETTNGEGSSDGSYDLLLLSDLVFNHSQHSALITTVNALLSSTPPPPPSSTDPCPTPSILVFTTHHRPHLAQADLAFFPLLAKSGSGWAYERIVEEYAGPMFKDDPGDERVRGTVKGWRCWRVGPGEEAGERESRIPADAI